MYQGKKRIMNPERHEEDRSQAISFRGGAIFNAFIDLEDIINKSVFAKTYMNHSQYWPSPLFLRFVRAEDVDVTGIEKCNKVVTKTLDSEKENSAPS